MEAPEIDKKAFESEVLSELDEFLTFSKQSDRGIKSRASRSSRRSDDEEEFLKKRNRYNNLYQRAVATLKHNKKVKKAICGGLTSLSEDMTDVAKNITYILLPLSMTKVVDVPFEPALYAMIAFVICKFSISSVCADSDKW